MTWLVIGREDTDPESFTAKKALKKRRLLTVLRSIGADPVIRPRGPQAQNATRSEYLPVEALTGLLILCTLQRAEQAGADGITCRRCAERARGRQTAVTRANLIGFGVQTG